MFDSLTLWLRSRRGSPLFFLVVWCLIHLGLIFFDAITSKDNNQVFHSCRFWYLSVLTLMCRGLLSQSKIAFRLNNLFGVPWFTVLSVIFALDNVCGPSVYFILVLITNPPSLASWVSRRLLAGLFVMFLRFFPLELLDLLLNSVREIPIAEGQLLLEYDADFQLPVAEVVSVSSLPLAVIPAHGVALELPERSLVHYILISALNGSHGEYTNQDDVVVFVYDHVIYTVDREKVSIEGEEPVPLEVVSIMPFRAFSYEFPMRKITFVPEIYQCMVSKLGILPDEPRNFTIICSYMNSKFGLLPASLITDCIYSYSYKNHFKSSPSALRGNVISLYGVINSGGVEVIPMTMSITPPLYEYNGRWKVLASKGFTLSVGSEMFLNRPVAFATEELPRQGVKNKQFLFTFTPRIPFETYGACAQNVCSAMSRYLKARPDENVLFSNQMRLLSGVPDEIIEESAECCGANYDRSTRNIYFREVYKNSRKTKEVDVVQIPAGEDIGYYKGKFLSSFYYLFLFRSFVDYVSSHYDIALLPILLVVYTYLVSFIHPYLYYSAVVFIPHIKQKLYQSWVGDAKTLEKVILNHGEWESKFKWEFGKKGKVGRLYATGDHLALVDKVECDYLKYVASIPVHFKFGETPAGAYIIHRENFFNYMLPWISKQSTIFNFYTQFYDAQRKEDCDRMFLEASNLPDNTGKFFYFSDDSFLVIRINGLLFLYEIDISQCDASNQFAIFTLCLYYLRVLGLGDNMKKLLVQASRPVTIRNPSDKSEFVKILSQSFFEVSGIKCTTSLNNTGCESIGMSIGQMFLQLLEVSLREGKELPSLDDIIPLAAARYGYVVTFARALNYNQVTFLKRAYNGITSWLVYGCVFRSLGITEGVLTHEMCNVTKSEFLCMNDVQKFERLLVSSVMGLCNEPGSIIMDSLRCRAGMTEFGKNKEFSRSKYRLSNQDILDRYGGYEYELFELSRLIDELQPFDIITCDYLERIFHRDYNSELTEKEEPVIRPNMSFDQTF